jgi:hypothetical protein
MHVGKRSSSDRATDTVLPLDQLGGYLESTMTFNALVARIHASAIAVNGMFS